MKQAIKILGAIALCLALAGTAGASVPPDADADAVALAMAKDLYAWAARQPGVDANLSVLVSALGGGRSLRPTAVQSVIPVLDDRVKANWEAITAIAPTDLNLKSRILMTAAIDTAVEAYFTLTRMLDGGEFITPYQIYEVVRRGAGTANRPVGEELVHYLELPKVRDYRGAGYANPGESYNWILWLTSVRLEVVEEAAKPKATVPALAEEKILTRRGR